MTSLLNLPWLRFAAFGVAIAAGLSSVVYSYIVWKREQRALPPGGIAANP